METLGCDGVTDRGLQATLVFFSLLSLSIAPSPWSEWGPRTLEAQPRTWPCSRSGRSKENERQRNFDVAQHDDVTPPRMAPGGAQDLLGTSRKA